ncbi:MULTISPECIES: DUF2788 domain-containing protein [Hydrogenophilus]|jgi:uncharacterized membrane protein YdbT with pleckstrin-like domain|uniref:DUF2788 domain-containing protein n=1 Tax=Hydrogenophilus thermoluteolus TaxID=297 RepID=A0A2Z6DW98_HYDTE|nr:MULTISPECIES: DUF2788 domain-containing protein [Hydrogenophilus]HCO77282.1 DUF2788 domain-containing protein [Rhodocyclaceae bacterium]MBW7656440.1 DUF2788 domain-containing protein [Hydrogenophilus thermoluteolus]BBD76720.1 hypothetical protein HPTL_0452 [Hydrogenophilus thermoluteolus]GLW60910.1 hypothetical protein Hthe01_12590 [Hydrogenophilus thermoluteolus]HNQ48226.1 DUF2788 domain-containing protein [Hydrogenophilus thermoluteolus]
MGEDLILGLTFEEWEEWALRILIPAFILYMIFIIGNLAWKSKAGKYGTLWLFVALGVGFIGFIAKGIIEWFMTH